MPSGKRVMMKQKVARKMVGKYERDIHSLAVILVNFHVTTLSELQN